MLVQTICLRYNKNEKGLIFMVLHERLAQLRKEKEISKRELSFLLNLEQSTYGKYELGKRQPSLEVLQKLADYFNVSTDYLLGNTDIKKQESIDNTATPEDAWIIDGKVIKFKDMPKEAQEEFERQLRLLVRAYNL
ncbi:MAG: helix-turn-helix transcriptional regulator [Bacteroidales bacterium]|jgi:transcriptional regulator with XRE-family HTH domain|nr:helix-turn-helix transcriptional regulator [Bacteroidales bacterium]